MRKLLLLLVAILISTDAFSDQCAYVKNITAQSAINFLEVNTKTKEKVLHFCQSCGDTQPQLASIDKVEIRETKNLEYPKEIFINDKAVDLAYVYIKISPNTWVNLGTLSNCGLILDTSQFIIERKKILGKTKFLPSAEKYQLKDKY